MEAHGKRILRNFLEQEGMQDVASLIDDSTDNDTIREALKEKLLQEDEIYQQMLIKRDMILKSGGYIGEAYEQMLDNRVDRILHKPSFQLINRLIENGELLGDCGCNGTF